MKDIIKKHPITAYYLITFGWTWTIVAIMMLSGQTIVGNPSPIFIVAGITCNISPSLAAFIVLGISEGKEGIQRLKKGVRKKASLKYYLLAIITVPTLSILTAIISSQFVRIYQFQVTLPIIFMGLVWPLFSGFGEEFGWRGLILPKMIVKHGLFKAGLLLGFIWELWHLPMHYMAYQSYGSYMIPAFLLIGFSNLILQSLIMAYIYTKSESSILLMILYHYTITASSIIISGLFKIEESPKLTVMESIITVILFLLFASALYWRKGIKVRGFR